MNFFKEIGKAVDKINAIGNLTHQANFFGSSKPKDALAELVQSCTYSDDAKTNIQKSIRQVLDVFPFYKPSPFQFAENGQPRRYVELIGQFAVEHQVKIVFHFMYPATFPKSPPFFRIINPNPQQFVPTKVYLPHQSKTDPKSFVINQILKESQTWHQGKSVVSIIVEANNLIRSNFPFQKIGQQQPNSHWGPVPYPNYGNQQQQQQNGWNNQGYGPKQPPIPFKPTNTINIAEIAAKSQMLVSDQKTKLQQLKTRHEAVLDKNQKLHSSLISCESEHLTMLSENKKMNNFMDSNQNSQYIRSFSDVVAPADPLSDQILQLTSSVKAREDCIHYLQTKFSEESISLEDFMKHVRRLQESKFEEKILLAKCVKRSMQNRA